MSFLRYMLHLPTLEGVSVLDGKLKEGMNCVHNIDAAEFGRWLFVVIFFQ